MSTVRRREVAARIKEAREFGDISENAEYDDAQERAGDARGADRAARGQAALGDRDRRDRARQRHSSRRTVVHVVDGDGGRRKYTIVGSAEAKPAELKLSNRVARRQGAYRSQEGRDVKFATPKASVKLKISKIEVA